MKLLSAIMEKGVDIESIYIQDVMNKNATISSHTNSKNDINNS